MCTLHIFVNTNICKPIFVTFGRIGAWGSKFAPMGEVKNGPLAGFEHTTHSSAGRDETPRPRRQGNFKVLFFGVLPMYVFFFQIPGYSFKSSCFRYHNYVCT
jgi:hypothetical protein